MSSRPKPNLTPTPVQVKNMEALDLPGFIQNYNGKPVLITRSGSLFKGDGYMEMDIRVHR